MKIHILMSGPIRPNKKVVLYNIQNIKKYFNGISFLSTWKSSDIDDDILKEFDFHVIKEELDNSIILEKICSTEPSGYHYYQNRVVPDAKRRIPPNISSFKMFLGISYMIDYIENNLLLNNDDIILRIRTDLNLILKNEFHEHIENLYNNDSLKNTYITNQWKGSVVGIMDWYSITTFSNFKKIWYYKNLDLIGSKDLERYNFEVFNSFNPEGLILNKIKSNKINLVFANNFVENVEIIR